MVEGVWKYVTEGKNPSNSQFPCGLSLFLNNQLPNAANKQADGREKPWSPKDKKQNPKSNS